MGEKVCYGRLCRYAGAQGNAFPAIESLGYECGVSEATARRYIKQLTAAKFIELEKRNGETYLFHFLWHPAFTGVLGTRRKDFKVRYKWPKGKPKRKKKTSVGVHISEPLPVHICEPPAVHICEPEESHHQENQVKRRGKGEREEREIRKKPKSKSSLNDEQKKGGETPENQFALRLLERQHDDAAGITRAVKNELGKANLPFQQFLDYDELKTTAPKKLTNPAGHYVKCARELVSASKTQTAEALVAGRAVMDAIKNGAKEDPVSSRCAKCQGSGFLAPSKFCDCAMGLDVAKVENRKRQKEALAALALPPKREQKVASRPRRRSAEGGA